MATAALPTHPVPAAVRKLGNGYTSRKVCIHEYRRIVASREWPVAYNGMGRTERAGDILAVIERAGRVVSVRATPPEILGYRLRCVGACRSKEVR